MQRLKLKNKCELYHHVEYY